MILVLITLAMMMIMMIKRMTVKDLIKTQVSGDGPRFLTDSDTKTVTIAGVNDHHDDRNNDDDYVDGGDDDDATKMVTIEGVNDDDDNYGAEKW